jgi:hypothetical protein
MVRRYKRLEQDFDLRNRVGVSPVVVKATTEHVDVDYDDLEWPGIAFAIDDVMTEKGFELNLVATGITDPDGTQTLDSVKTRWFFQIDRRTSELIAEGFTFAAKTFSLNITAQAALLGMMCAINNPTLAPMLTWPVNWNTKDDFNYHAIPDAATFETFYITAMGTYRNWLDTGTALKDQVRAATTIAEVEAIVDPR